MKVRPKDTTPVDMMCNTVFPRAEASSNGVWLTCGVREGFLTIERLRCMVATCERLEDERARAALEPKAD